MGGLCPTGITGTTDDNEEEEEVEEDVENRASFSSSIDVVVCSLPSSVMRLPRCPSLKKNNNVVVVVVVVSLHHKKK
jgi:hypothetical protein